MFDNLCCRKFKSKVASPPVSNHPLLVKTLLQVAPDVFNKCRVDVKKMDISGILCTW